MLELYMSATNDLDSRNTRDIIKRRLTINLHSNVLPVIVTTSVSRTIDNRLTKTNCIIKQKRQPGKTNNIMEERENMKIMYNDQERR